MDVRQLISSNDVTAQLIALRLVLRALSWPYRVAVWLRNRAFDVGWLRSHRLPIPVISVGNLSVGGTGKTPVVAWLVRHLRSLGIRVAIVSRGYGKLDDGRNDEALELELSLPDVPHIQNPDRVAAGQLAVEELDMQLLVLDDAFQHRRIARDLDIVLIDASDPRQVRCLLPAGLYREPISELSRAHVVILTRVDQASPQQLENTQHAIRIHAPQARIASTQHRPTGFKVFPAHQTLPLETLRGRKVLAFCGIGNPPAFFHSLVDSGVVVLSHRIYPDHHPFAPEDIAQLDAWSKEFTDAEYFVCTVKDWVKLQTARIGLLPLVALEVDLVFLDGEASFLESIASVLQHASCQPC